MIEWGWPDREEELTRREKIGAFHDSASVAFFVSLLGDWREQGYSMAWVVVVVLVIDIGLAIALFDRKRRHIVRTIFTIYSVAGLVVGVIAEIAIAALIWR